MTGTFDWAGLDLTGTFDWAGSDLTGPFDWAGSGASYGVQKRMQWWGRWRRMKRLVCDQWEGDRMCERAGRERVCVREGGEVG